ncbi:hypothetical protein H9P43_008355 [Blastocladiella emersonii ATCC 22665]|nr:hypothetical protein H9P43_008355 [Blastocladiella emersonii ATCC 22665]
MFARRLIPSAAVASAVVAHHVATTTSSSTGPTAGAAALLPVRAVHLEAGAAAAGSDDRLPIYDAPPRQYEVVAIPPNRLELAIRESRYALSASLQSTKASLQSLVSGWIAVERKISDAVHSVKSPEERLIPSSLYVVVAAFTGSFIVRNRNMLVRALVPPTFFLAASAYFLPYTTTNAYNLVFRNLPPEAQLQLTEAQERSRETLDTVRGRLSEIQGKARELGTGLKADAAGIIPAAILRNKPSTEEVVAKVESMYSTRGSPGVKDVIEADRKEQGEH